MPRQLQKRTQETRARLLKSARYHVTKVGYAGLRVEDVVKRAEVAKGTFFAHFKDKDVLLDNLIGAEMDRLLQIMETSPAPGSIDDFIDHMEPLLLFIAQDRYTFDVIIRHSGATASDQIGPIAEAFHRHMALCQVWVSGAAFRKDVHPSLLAHGVQAFMIHAVGLEFCALHVGEALRARLNAYLQAWLMEPGASAARL